MGNEVKIFTTKWPTSNLDTAKYFRWIPPIWQTRRIRVLSPVVTASAKIILREYLERDTSWYSRGLLT